MSDISQIIDAVNQGDLDATERLLEAVYEQLHLLAQQKMRHERPGHTLQATALVHEAYLRLLGTDGPWEGRRHFFAAAAEAMRRSLIDHARRKAAVKHGGNLQREPLDNVELELTIGPDPIDLLELNDALDAFELEDPDKASLVKLRFFAGMTSQEAAEALGISSTTAERHWAYARAWLFDRLHGGDCE